MIVRTGHEGSHWRGQTVVSLLLGVYLVLCTAVAAGAAHVLHQRSALSATSGVMQLATLSAADQANTAKYLVLMVLDGGRPGYLKIKGLPHVDALKAEGTQYTHVIDGILEAETPAGHATLATGSPPARNGILGFDWANDNDRYSLFNPNQMGQLETIMEKAGVPTIAGLFKAKYKHARVVALSGHKYYAAAPLGGPHADAIMYYEGNAKGQYVPVAVPGHVPPKSVLTAKGVISPTTKNGAKGEDNLATRLALAAFRIMKPRVTLINYAHFDWPLGHIFGGSKDPKEVRLVTQGFDHDLGMIEKAYRKAGILNKTLFVITADHGMMPITHFVPSSLIENAVAQAGTTAPDISTDSADYVWLADPSKAQAVADIIAGAHNEAIQSVYYLVGSGTSAHYIRSSASALSPKQENANQDLLSALLNGHEPQVVVFGKKGASFNDPSKGWKGDHGGNQWASQHIPLILAGPGIRSGAVINTPAQLEDVAPTVLTDLGVAPRGMSGHILSDALISPPAGSSAARAREVHRIAPVVSSLQTGH